MGDLDKQLKGFAGAGVLEILEDDAVGGDLPGGVHGPVRADSFCSGYPDSSVFTVPEPASVILAGNRSLL